MSLLKDREDLNRIPDSKIASDDRRTLRRAFIVVVLLAAGIGTAIYLFQFVDMSAGPLAEARSELRSYLTDQPEHRLQHARSAAQAIRGITLGARARVSTRNALLSAALSAEQRALGADVPIGIGDELEGLFQSIRPRDCESDDLLLVAKILSQTGRSHHAEWLIGESLKRDIKPDARAEILGLAAHVSYDAGNEKAVIKYAQELAELRPDEPASWRLMASVYEDQGYPEPLLPAYRKLLELRVPDEVEIREKLADRYLEVGQTADAVQQVEWLQVNAPAENEKRSLLKAKLLLQQGETSRAADIIDSLIQTDPNHEEAVLLKGQILIARQELGEAVELLNGYVVKYPLSNAAHYSLGQALARLGQRELAQKHLNTHRRLLDASVRLHRLERQAGREPNNAAIRREIAGIYKSLGVDDAADHWEQAADAVRQ
jgi:predicted Zn-dependent protease